MEGKVSDGKAIQLMSKLWSSSEWKDKLMYLCAPELVDVSFLALPHKTRTSSIVKYLGELSMADQLALSCLTDVLPMKMESKYLLNYLITRLSSKYANIQVETQKHQMKHLTNFLEKVDSTKIIYEWQENRKIKELKEEIEAKVCEITYRNEAEIKDRWIFKYVQAQKERNKYKSMLNRCLHTIYENRFTKATLNVIYDKVIDCIQSFNYIAKRIYCYGGARMKKWTNITQRKLNRLEKYVKGKLIGFNYQEELDILQKYNLEEQGLLWSSLAREMISQNPKLEAIYNKLDLQQKYSAMQLAVRNTQNLKNINEIKLQIKANISENMKLLQSSTETSEPSLNINLSAIKAENEEWEEVEEEESEIDTTNHEKTRYYKDIFKRNPPGQK